MSDVRLAMVFWEGPSEDGAVVALMRALEQWRGGEIPVEEEPAAEDGGDDPDADPEETPEEGGEDEDPAAAADADEDPAEEETPKRRRRSPVSDEEVLQMVELRDAGSSVAQIAAETGRSRVTVANVIRKHDAEVEAAVEAAGDDGAEDEEEQEEEAPEEAAPATSAATPPEKKGPITKADVERWVQQRRNGATVTAIAQEAERDKATVYHYITLFERHKI